MDLLQQQQLQQQQHFELFGIGSAAAATNFTVNVKKMKKFANHSPQDGLYVSQTFPTTVKVVPKDEMMITQQTVSEKLLAYLDNQLSFNQIVTWAEHVIHEGNYTPDSNIELLEGIVMTLAGADRPRLCSARPS